MIPTKEQMEKWLKDAGQMNPGPWVEHSRGAARAARELAKALGLDAERAYAMGLLHDIGRFEGVTGIHHVIAGYQFMMQKGYPDIARICLTHSFPNKIPDEAADNMDRLDEAEKRFLYEYLEGAVYDEYDRLMQLVDAITWGEGVCLMEKRLVDVALRYGVKDTTLQKWKAWFAIKADFEGRIGASIYSLFPEAAANTFGENP